MYIMYLHCVVTAQYIDGLVQDSSISIANALEILDTAVLLDMV